MGTDQRFSLRWNNYQSHLVTAFESLLDKKDFVDVTLGVEGKKLPAHKMLLSACSPYFRELLKENPCQHPIIILRDINYLDLHSLLQFMYNGEVNVAQEQLNSFLKTAESLKIRGLTDMEEGERDPEPARPLVRERLHASQSSDRRSPPLPPKKMRTSFGDLPPVAPASPISLPPPRLPPPPPVKQELIDIGEDSENHQDQDLNRNGYVNETETSDVALNSINADYEHEDYHERTVVVRGANLEATLGHGATMEATLGHGANMETAYDHGQHLSYPPYGTKVMYSSGGVEQSPEMVECPSCGKNFRSRRAWKNHNVVHESEGGQLLCKVCGKQQSSGTNYRRHLKMNHGIEGDPFSY